MHRMTGMGELECLDRATLEPSAGGVLWPERSMPEVSSGGAAPALARMVPSLERGRERRERERERASSAPPPTLSPSSGSMLLIVFFFNIVGRRLARCEAKGDVDDEGEGDGAADADCGVVGVNRERRQRSG